MDQTFTLSPEALTSDQQRLIDARAIKQAEKAAGWWAKRVPVEYEELHQAALSGLVEAARSFNPNLGAAFHTWAYNCINTACNDIIRQYRRETSKRECMSAFASMERLNDSLDRWETLPGEFTDIGQIMDARSLLSCLTERERDIVVRHVINGEMMSDIAAETGISRAAIQQINKRALDKLRREMENRAR